MADGMNSFVDRSPLPERLAEIRARHPSAEPDAIAEVVRAVLCTMKGDLSGTDTSLLTEVEELGRTIARAKAEIAALKVDDISAAHIPSATDELDAIVAHTAAATDRLRDKTRGPDARGGDRIGVVGIDDVAVAGHATCATDGQGHATCTDHQGVGDGDRPIAAAGTDRLGQEAVGKGTAAADDAARQVHGDSTLRARDARTMGPEDQVGGVEGPTGLGTDGEG